MQQGRERVTFSFGENWRAFLDTLHPQAIEAARVDFERWLPDGLAGKSFLDVGCGSGLHSLVAWQLGARPVLSFDLDPHSVGATTRLWEQAGRPEEWQVESGSILDAEWIRTLPRFDAVYSWGVLHHTGAMWEAVRNVADRVAYGGWLWIGLYRRTPISGRSLRIKRAYNALPAVLKPAARGVYVCTLIAKWLLRGRNPVTRIKDHWRSHRGMNFWRDIEDWLGGLPYEVAAPGEVLAFLRPRGFTLERLLTGHVEGGIDVYLFRREPETAVRTTRGHGVPDDHSHPSCSIPPIHSGTPRGVARP